MQSNAWWVSTLLLGTLSYAGKNVAGATPQVNVFVTSDINDETRGELKCGMLLAASMFAKVGVQIRWQTGSADTSAKAPSIRIQINIVVCDSSPTGRVAFAKPFARGDIIIFWNRLELAARHGNLSALAGHVLAHELTHVLTSTDGHTREGLMKAHWTYEDIWRMSTRPLPFDSWDIEVIRQRLR